MIKVKKMKMNQMALYALMAAGAVSLSGCNKEEIVKPNVTTCAEHGFKARYEDGRKKADAENKADIERGTADGNALGTVEGKEAGLKTAYTKGYNAGYKTGYDERYPAGYTAGRNDATTISKAVSEGAWDGAQFGAADGTDDGYEDGFLIGTDEGDADGFSDGYNDGFYDGQISALDDPGYYCSSSNVGRKKKVVPADFSDQCYTKGYNEVRDSPGAYNRAFAAAKNDNVEYNAAFNQYKDDPTQVAAGTAQGYADGKLKGYNDGFAQGKADIYNQIYKTSFDSSYVPNYNTNYALAYDTGRYDGYNEAYSYAYNDAYDVGFEDGVDDACWALAWGRKNTSSGKMSASDRKYRKSSDYLKKLGEGEGKRLTHGSRAVNGYRSPKYKIGRPMPAEGYGTGRLVELRKSLGKQNLNIKRLVTGLHPLTKDYTFRD